MFHLFLSGKYIARVVCCPLLTFLFHVYLITSITFFRHVVPGGCELASAKGVRLNRTHSRYIKIGVPSQEEWQYKTFAPPADFPISPRASHLLLLPPSSQPSKGPTGQQSLAFTLHNNQASTQEQPPNSGKNQSTMGFIHRTSKQTGRVKNLLGLALSRLAVARRPRLARKSISRGDVGQLLTLGHLDRALHRVSSSLYMRPDIVT